MMKQVINWTFGGFFRTIGRTLAFIVIGIAIAYIFSVADIKLPNIFRFALTQVNASTYGYIYSDNVQWSFGNGYWNNPTYGNGYWSFDDSNNSSQELYYFRFTQVSLPSNANSINVNIRFNVTSWKEQQITSNSPFTCTVNSHSEWLNIDDSSSPMQDDYEFQIDDFVCQSYNTTTKTYNNDFGLSLYYVSNSGITDYYPCYAVSSAGNVYNFSCPIQSNNISGYRLVLNSNSDMDYVISMSNLSVYNTDTTQQIIQQQQETNNQINNTNTTQESNETASFFTNYQDRTPTALTAVVSAPLDIFNKLLTNVSSPLCFVLKSKQVCIPTGAMIWNKSSRTSFVIDNKVVTPHPFNSDTSLDTSGLVQLFNLVAGGYLCYKMLISLFRTVEENILNPTNSKVKVIKL